MKYSTFLSALVFMLFNVSTYVFSQAPNYYFQNNPVWQVKHTIMAQTPCGVVLTREYSISPTDTSINGTLCKRLMKKEQSLGTQVLTMPPFTPYTCPNPQAPYYQSTPQVYAYVRSVGKQIFIRQLNSINTEQLLYDFNLNIGSITNTATCLYNSSQTITAIDSVSTPNGFRKRYFSGSNNLVFIEGIGHPMGFVPPELMQPNVSGFSSEFLCYQQNGIVCTTGFSGGSNCIALGVEEKKNGNQVVSVYPNPIQTNGFITLANEVKNGELFIYNAIGKEVKHTKGVNGMAVKIERSDLTNGVYFFSIKQKEAEVFKGKFVVAD
jgi:hypothetical protein